MFQNSNPANHPGLNVNDTSNSGSGQPSCSLNDVKQGAYKFLDVFQSTSEMMGMVLNAQRCEGQAYIRETQARLAEFKIKAQYNDLQFQSADTERKLRAEILDLKSELRQSRVAINDLRLLCAEREAQIDQPRPRSPSMSSLAPSDSVSQVQLSPSPHILPTRLQPERPSERPEGIHRDALWLLNDCMEDKKGACPSYSNASRINMAKAIRTAKGELISQEQWRLIQLLARAAIDHYLTNLTKQVGPQTITYYRKHHMEALKHAVSHLEMKEPLVAICAGHWKAEHIIKNELRAICNKAKNRKRSRPDGENVVIGTSQHVPDVEGSRDRATASWSSSGDSAKRQRIGESLDAPVEEHIKGKALHEL